MEQHDVEIEIGKDGKVRVHVKGAKGKACLEYAKLLEKIVGRQESRELTAEYYEPGSQVRLGEERELRVEDRRD
jgi:hypothetical protein